MSRNIFEAIQNHNLIDLANALARGENPNILSPEWPAWTPLHEAIEQLEDGESLDVLVFLLRFGAFVDMWDAAHQSTYERLPLRNQTKDDAIWLAAEALLLNDFHPRSNIKTII